MPGKGIAVEAWASIEGAGTRHCRTRVAELPFLLEQYGSRQRKHLMGFRRSFRRRHDPGSPRLLGLVHRLVGAIDEMRHPLIAADCGYAGREAQVQVRRDGREARLG